MKHQHLLRVEQGAAEFAALIAALGERGWRAGWLELKAPEPVAENLETAAGAGALRAVAVGGGRSVALKPMKGAPVVRDVLREHFHGCRLVLVRGELDAPLLAPRGEGWVVSGADGAERGYATEDLVEALGRPRPWGAPPSP